MTTHKIIYNPTIKEPKVNHDLAASSAFNLKMCLNVFCLFHSKKTHYPIVHWTVTVLTLDFNINNLLFKYMLKVCTYPNSFTQILKYHILRMDCPVIPTFLGHNVHIK